MYTYIHIYTHKTHTHQHTGLTLADMWNLIKESETLLVVPNTIHQTIYFITYSHQTLFIYYIFTYIHATHTYRRDARRHVGPHQWIWKYDSGPKHCIRITDWHIHTLTYKRDARRHVGPHQWIWNLESGPKHYTLFTIYVLHFTYSHTSHTDRRNLDSGPKHHICITYSNKYTHIHAWR